SVTTTVETASTADTTVAVNRVIQTGPPAGAMARPSDVVITKNPTGDSDQCNLRVDYPHWSSAGQTTIAKGYATCNYQDDGVIITMRMWKCDSSPSVDLAAVQTGQWGCSEVPSNTETRAVMPGIEALP